MIRRLCVLVLLASPVFAVDKAILELQRQMGALEDLIQKLQQSQDQKLTEIRVISQQALDAANKANTAVAVIENNLRQSTRETQEKVVAPVVGVNSRMDTMSNELRTTQQAVGDLAAAIQKLQQQMGDLIMAVKTIQTPPPPPPGQSTSVPGPSQPDVPTIPAMTLYENARRDQGSGKLDLALQEFSDYLKWYGNTDYAPNAQFYIAFIHYSMKDYERALNEFDIVLEKYPENNKTADAMLYKGRTLVAMDRRTDGSKEFQEVYRRYPSSDQSRQACDQLKNLGMNCGVPRGAPSRSTVSKNKKK